MSHAETSPFGRGLRHWRRLRGVGQLDLASAAATTTRHVSFLETGRSRPSRQMVDRLGDALQIPLRERNRLLEVVCLAATYPEGDLADAGPAPFQRAIERLLASREPFPGFVIDGSPRTGRGLTGQGAGDADVGEASPAAHGAGEPPVTDATNLGISVSASRPASIRPSSA